MQGSRDAMLASGEKKNSFYSDKQKTNLNKAIKYFVIVCIVNTTFLKIWIKIGKLRKTTFLNLIGNKFTRLVKIEDPE